MPTPPPWFRALMSALSRLWPALATAVAWRLFWALGAPAEVRPVERATHEAATTGRVTVRGMPVTTYAWGDPAGPVVVLVHGWRSRASRFAVLVDALVAAGYRVLSFDAPGNGASGGRRTMVYDYAAAVRALTTGHERVAAVVGHSLGALAACIAVRRGTPAAAVVTIAGVHDFEHVVRSFCESLRLDARARAALRRRLERTFEEDPDLRALVDGDLWDDVVSRLDRPEVPLLAVHDETDGSVPVQQSHAIVEQHGERGRLVTTRGLGHSRLLADPSVVAVVLDAVGAGSAPVGEEPGAPARTERVGGAALQG